MLFPLPRPPAPQLFVTRDYSEIDDTFKIRSFTIMKISNVRGPIIQN